jgi:hypothetical protein
VEALEDRLAPANVQWTGGAGTLKWTDTHNWSTGALPGSSDDVTINIAVSGPITIGSGTQSINSLTDTTASLSLTGGSLTLAAASSISQSISVGFPSTLTAGGSLSVGGLTLSSGALTGAGTVTVSGLLVWTGGTMSGTGETVASGGVQFGAPAGMTGTGLEVLDTRTLILGGSSTLNDGSNSNLKLESSAALQIQAGGSLDVLSGLITTDGHGEPFTNAGTLSVDAGSTTSQIWPAFTNSGSVQVNSGTLSLLSAGTQTGTFSVASGATLDFALNFNTAATTMAAGSSFSGAGTVEFEGSSTTTFASGSVYNLTGTTEVVGAVTFNAPVTSLGSSLIIAGSGFGATLTLNTGQTLSVSTFTQSAGTLTGSDNLTVSGQFSYSGGAISTFGTVTADGPAQIGGANGFVGITASTLVLAGTSTLNNVEVILSQSANLEVQAGASLDLLAGSVITNDNTGTLTNNGTLSVDAGTGGTFSVSATLTNAGTLKVNSGTFSLTGPFTNFAASTLTGGTYDVLSTFKFNNAAIQTNAANLTLDGPAATIVNQSNSSALVNFSTNAAGASFTLLDGQQLSTATPFTNSGAFTVDATGGASRFTVVTSYTQSGAGAVTTLVAGGSLVAHTTVTIGTGTTVQGTGTVTGTAVTNSGTFSPGTATVPGDLTVSGVYTQSSTGTLDVKLGGAGAAGTAYDLLSASGGMLLAGTIDVTEVNGFVPQAGNQFQVLSFGPTANPGDFATKTGYSPGNGIVFNEQFSPNPNPTGMTLIVGQRHLQFLNQPNDTPAGGDIDPGTGIQVELLDSNGNPMTGDNTDQVTLTTGTTAFGPVTAVNGVATFGSVFLTTAGSYQLTASSTNFASVVSNSFNITPGQPSQLEVTSQPKSVRVGDSIGTIVVQVEDEFHNLETTVGGQMSVAMNGVPFALDGGYFETILGGVATFGDLSVSQAATGYDLMFSGAGFQVTSNAFDISPLDTTTVAAGASGTIGQDVTLRATVSPVNSSFPLAEGTVTFKVFNGSTQIGNSVVSNTVDFGQASASFAIPSNTPPGSYTVEAFYSDTTGTNFNASQSDPGNDGTLMVTTAPATTTAAANASATFSSGSQSVTLSASVTSGGGTVNEGTVTFAVFLGSTQIGNPATSGTVNGGAASADFTLPAGTAARTYTIHATYNPGPDFSGSSDNTHQLTVGAASTTTAAANATATFSASSQTVTLSATVTGGGGPVNEGSVNFAVFAGATQIGNAFTGAPVAAGAASAAFTLPAGTAAGTYSIHATYNPSLDFTGSGDNTHQLTVSDATTATASANASATFGSNSQSVTLSATVTNGGGPVNEGTVTFAVFAGATQIGSSVTSGTVASGAASAAFTLPGGTAAGSYTIDATYNPGPDFTGSSDNTHQLTVAAASTTTAAGNASATFSSAGQVVTLSATVTSGGGPVNEGTVTFAVFAGATQIGNAVTSATVAAGAATAAFTLPGGTSAGTYTIDATYNPTTNYAASSDNTHHLAVALNGSQPPVLPPVNGNNAVTLPFTQFPYATPLNAATVDGNPLTYSASAEADSPLYDLRQQYQFSGIGTMTAGATAYVLHSNQPGPGAGGYYLLRPADGALYAYDGSGSYAHTFANANNLLATLGANVGADPTLLMSALPPADYATLQSLQATFQFTGAGYATAGATAYVLHSDQTGPGVGGYYLIRPSDGALFAYDGSGSFAHTFANSSPLATLRASVYSFPAELLNAQAAPSLYAQLYQVDQQLDLQELGGSFYTNTLGHQAEWLYSPVPNQYGQHWYTLLLSGSQSVLHAWEGYQDSSVGAVVATFNSAAVYNDPTLLTTATFLPNPAAGTATVDASGNLTVNPPSAGFVGTFKVVVTVTAGQRSTSETVTVNATDTAPTLSVTNNGNTISGTQTVTAGSFPLSDTVATTGAGGATVTASASAASYNPSFALQQRYQFKGLGYFTAGATAYLLQATGNNAFGNNFYLLKSDGSLYAYDGSGSFASSFNGTALASLGGNVYADPTLLLNAQPAVDYATLFNLQQQYQFTGVGTVTAGATAYVLHSNQAGPGVGGYYLLGTDGTLVPYDGTGSYAHSFAGGTPLATLDPGVFANPALLLNAKAAPGLYAALLSAEQQFDVQEYQGSFYTGLSGNAAKWLYSVIPNGRGQHWYTLVPSADGSRALLYAWDGGSNSVPGGATPVAAFDASVYADPTLLTNAKAPLAAAGVTAGVANGTLTVNAPASFTGTFQVTVTATDGGLTTTETFRVTSTDTPPTPNPISGQSASQSGAPLQLTLGSTGGNGQVSYSASAVGYGAAYNLEQQYHFTGLGFVSAGGATAYVLQSSVLGGAGGYYLLKSDGGVYAYDGSGSFAHTFANSANLITTLDPGVFTTPTLLTQAQAPATPAAAVSVSGNTLTVNVAGVAVGTVFEVFVTASDGAESQRTGFLVTVTA